MRRFRLTVTPLAYGFQLADAAFPPPFAGKGSAAADMPISNIAVITESDFINMLPAAATKRGANTMPFQTACCRDLAEINIGDPVVHEEHGIGRYMGLVNMDLGEGGNEMMLLEYADEAQSDVPVSQLHLISRYAGHAADMYTCTSSAAAHGQSQAPCRRKQARDTAAELLNCICPTRRPTRP